ncbi:transmembrane protein 252 isoform X2 [Seriola lalandi dorsalis]|uniref:transmembrane protein 252 isoform X2 n=1 Tax=Seriola lalandi dorsalis TaxID=1841481 RepID=UPI000C6F7FA3|nr:transmembrane protein 252 isoform X2 [Seriola lalandi dorsalis]
MIMNVKKQLWSLARIVLPGVGFALTCIGAYLVSLQTEYQHTWKVIPGYIVIVFGFLAMLVGVFWTICLSMKNRAPFLHHMRSPREAKSLLIQSLRLWLWSTEWMLSWVSLLRCTARTAQRPRTARGAGSSLRNTLSSSVFSKSRDRD